MIVLRQLKTNQPRKGYNMDCVLRSFDVINNNGEVVSHFELFKRGYTRELRTSTEVIYTGFDANKEYFNTLELNKQLAVMLGCRVVETK